VDVSGKGGGKKTERKGGGGGGCKTSVTSEQGSLNGTWSSRGWGNETTLVMAAPPNALGATKGAVRIGLLAATPSVLIGVFGLSRYLSTDLRQTATRWLARNRVGRGAGGVRGASRSLLAPRFLLLAIAGATVAYQITVAATFTSLVPDGVVLVIAFGFGPERAAVAHCVGGRPGARSPQASDRAGVDRGWPARVGVAPACGTRRHHHRMASAVAYVMTAAAISQRNN